MSARWSKGMAAQAVLARLAMPTARSTSAALATPMVPMRSPVAGSVTAAWPPSEARQSGLKIRASQVGAPGWAALAMAAMEEG